MNEVPQGRVRKGGSRSPHLWMAGGYLLFGLVWIFGTDYGLARLAPPDVDSLIALSMIKGVGFVAVSALWFLLALRSQAQAAATGPSDGADVSWRRPIFIVLAGSLAVVTAGQLFMRYEQQAIRDGRTRELAAVASLEAAAAAEWFDDRRGFLHYMSTSEFFSRGVAAWLDSGDPEARRLVEVRMASVRTEGDYTTVMLCDASGQVLVAIGQAFDLDATGLRQLDLAYATRQVQVGNARSLPSIAGPVIDFVVALAPRDAASGVPVAALVARADARSLLAQRVGKVPEVGATAETLLARREGPRTLFVSPRQKPVPGHPVEQDAGVAVPAVRIAAGETGLVEGLDYAGDRVLAVGRPVQGTDLFVIAKVDAKEAFAPLHRAGGLVGLAMLATLALMTAALADWWRSYRIETAARLKGEIERQRMHFALASRYVNDAILLVDGERRLLEANDRALDMYGYDRDSLLQLRLDDLRASGSDDAAQAPGHFQRVIAEGRIRFETVHRRRDGVQFPVEVSARRFDLDGRPYVQSVVRDISDRKRAERLLRESEGRLRLFVDHAPAALAMFDRDMCYMAFSRRWLQDYSLGERNLKGLRHYDVFPEIDDTWKAVHCRALAGEVVTADKDRFVRADGTVQWLRWEVRPWHRDDGGIGGLMVFSEDITARQAAADQLSSLVHKLQRAEEHGGLGSWEFDVASGKSWWSEQMYRLVGFEPGAAVPEPEDYLAHLHPDDRALARDAMRGMAVGEKPEPRVFRSNPALGPVRCLSPTVHCERDEAGRVLRFSGTLLDITEIDAARRQLEHWIRLYDLLYECSQTAVRVRDKETLFAAITHNAVEHGGFCFAWIGECGPDGVVAPQSVHGPTSGYVERQQQVLRSPPEATVGPTREALRTGLAVVCNDFLAEPRVAPMHELAAEAGIRSSGTFPFQPKHGPAGVLKVYADELDFFDTETVRTLEEIADDIAFALDAMRLRRELDDSRLLLQSVIDNSGAAIYVVDPDGRLLLLNDHCAAAIGAPREQLIGRLREEVEPAAAARVHRENDLDVLSTGNTRVFEEIGPEPGGGRVYLSSKTVLRDGAGGLIGICGVSTDITALRRAEQALRQANRTLEARVAERTVELELARDAAQAADRAKSLFLATMTHELRSPLNSILGFTSLLLEGATGPLNDPQQGQLTIIHDASRHLLAIINDMLDLSKVEAGAMDIAQESYDLQSVVDAVLARYAVQARQRGLALLQRGERAQLRPVGDKRRVEQVLGNLLSNAVKFTEQGVVTVTVSVTGDRLKIAVNDTGPGISATDRQHLFKHFSQLAPRAGELREGTGLGLAIAARLADAMGGSIELESRPGVGSTFTLVLPVAPEGGAGVMGG